MLASNYWSNAVSVIDTKWWINRPDDSLCLNQSVSQYATLGRQRDIRLLMTVDLFTDHWPLDPQGKCVHLLQSVRQRPTVACKWESEETKKGPWSISETFLFEFGSWKERCIHLYCPYPSLSFSLRFTYVIVSFNMGNQYRIAVSSLLRFMNWRK